MLTDKEFDDAFTAVGGRFFANTYEYIADNMDLDSAELISKLYPLGYDANRSGTSTRVSSSKRLISDNLGIRALRKVACSKRIKPDAISTANRILKERFNI
ncbi:MAG TPA: hypothetical protein VFC84_03455 [Desulfosporosinus sp.]|nr:hypothetical protein [Desulfosporosinus sp.]